MLGWSKENGAFPKTFRFVLLQGREIKNNLDSANNQTDSGLDGCPQLRILLFQKYLKNTVLTKNK